MSDNGKRAIFGVLAVICFLWLRNSWATYQTLGGNPKVSLVAGVFMILFVLLTIVPSPGRKS